MKKVGIIGAGAWGTALGVSANRAGVDVIIGTRNQHVIESVRRKNQNDQYLPGIFLDPAIKMTESMSEVCGADLVVFAIPAQHLRSACISVSDFLDPRVPILITCKGIERGSLSLMTEVVGSVLPDNPVAVLSGPNFADETARGQPTATTIACANPRIGEQVMFMMGSSLFRPYLNDDLIGTQIGGAVKNVVAIACGIATGKGFGENARAALITRSMSEIRRLCVAKGGKEETLMGLSGMGDLVLTCTSRRSRNTSLGIALGEGKSVEEATGRREGALEGVPTAESVKQLADQLGIDMPISRAVYEILYEDANIDETIAWLLERPFAKENY